MLAEQAGNLNGSKGKLLLPDEEQLQRYSLPVWKTVRPWMKLELRNVLNNDTLTTWNIAVTPDNEGPKDADGLPTNYIKGRNYGKGTGTGNYPVPREFLFSVGVRF